MYMLQLFDVDDAVQPIDARLLRDGAISIGRDTKCDWPIADPDRALSREHCEVAVSADGLIVRPIGTNGVFDDETGDRLPDLVDVSVDVPFTLRMGRFRISATRAPLDDEVTDTTRTMVLTPPLGASTAIPTDWVDAQPIAASAVRSSRWASTGPAMAWTSSGSTCSRPERAAEARAARSSCRPARGEEPRRRCGERREASTRATT